MYVPAKDNIKIMYQVVDDKITRLILTMDKNFAAQAFIILV